MVIVLVATEHVGCSVTLAVGAAGAEGAVVTTTFPDAAEVQVDIPSVTVKVYVPAARDDIVVVAPVPVVVVPPGVLVRVHVPAEGKPLNATLPVAVAQVGWVIVPTTGADGVAG